MQEKNQQSNNRAQFKQAQLSLGLRKQFFDAKFVYSQQQISNSDAFLIPLYKQLPSQIHGFTYNEIQIIHSMSSQIIHQAAKSLQVPVCTEILAQCLFHFFYARKSFLEYDIRDTMMGCMYLACKSEETLKKSYQIAMTFDYIFKIYQGDKKISPLEVGSSQYQHIKNQTILKAELDILFQLGFQIYKLFDLPHRYIGTVVSLFDRHPKYNLICQSTWRFLNDSYRTIACLYFPHQNICAAAIYMGMRQSGANFPQIPWWTLLESTQQNILNIEILIKNLSRNKDKVKFSSLAAIITQKGQRQGILNVFPVPYYRKIMLQKREKLRIKKNDQNQAQKQKRNSEINNQVNNQTQSINNKKPLNINHQDEGNNKNLSNENKINSLEGFSDSKISTKIEQLKQQKKPIIDKKNLLANISQKLQKHEAAVKKKTEEKVQELQKSSSSEEDLEDIAQLRKKIQRNKQVQKDQKNI